MRPTAPTFPRSTRRSSILSRPSGRRSEPLLKNATVVVGGRGEGETPSDTLEPAVAGLAQTARDFDPAEGLLDALADALAQGIAGVTGRAPIDGRGAVGRILGDMRGDIHLPQLRHMPGYVEGLVRTERNPSASWHIAHHDLRRLALGGAGSMRGLGVHDQAVTVLHQQMAHIAELGCLSLGFAVEPRIGVGGGGVCLVAPPLAAEVPRAVSPRLGCLIAAVLGSEALHARPGFDEGAINREVLS